MAKLFNEPCPRCQHPVYTHWGGGCQEAVGDPQVSWGGNSPKDLARVRTPICGCPLLKCEKCEHYARDHSETGCHPDLGSEQCECTETDTAIYQRDAASSA